MNINEDPQIQQTDPPISTTGAPMDPHVLDPRFIIEWSPHTTILVL